MATTGPIEQPSRLLTVPEISERTGFGPKFLREEIRAGRLRAYCAGKRWLRVSASDFEAWLEEQRVAPSAPASAHAWAEDQVERERLAGAPR